MRFSTISPVTGQVTFEIEGHGPAEVDDRLALSNNAALELGHFEMGERARLLVEAASLLEAELPVVAELLTREMGKLFTQARAEVSKCAFAMRYVAEHGPLQLAPRVVNPGRQFVRYEPLGPILAVMPWNFPLWQVIRCAAPQLLIGNPVVLKHAANVPQSAIFLEHLFLRAGYPKGSFVSLLIESNMVADVIADKRIKAVTLTGSESAGRAVGSQASAVIKKCVLELGGSDPFVVLPSADINRAASVGVGARLQNNGQSCIAAKRFIVHESVYDQFIEAMKKEMESIHVGDPMDMSTDVGPLATSNQKQEFDAQIDDARKLGARVSIFGGVLPPNGWFVFPCIIETATTSMRVYSEEVFGPGALIERCRDLGHAIELANRTTFALGASVWTNDDDEKSICIDQIEAGMVFVNEMVASSSDIPFGGAKRSGFGRELGDEGMKEFTNIKSVSLYQGDVTKGS